MKCLREEMQSVKKASEAKVDKTSDSISKAGPSKQPDPTTWASDPTTRMLNLWTQTSVVLLSHQDLLKVFSPTMAPSTRIFNPTTRINNPTTRNNLKGCVLPELRNTWTRRNTRLGQSTILSRLLQRKISPLSLSKSRLSPENRLLMSTTNNRITQTQFFTGR